MGSSARSDPSNLKETPCLGPYAERCAAKAKARRLLSTFQKLLSAKILLQKAVCCRWDFSRPGGWAVMSLGWLRDPVQPQPRLACGTVALSPPSVSQI